MKAIHQPLKQKQNTAVSGSKVKLVKLLALYCLPKKHKQGMEITLPSNSLSKDQEDYRLSERSQNQKEVACHTAPRLTLPEVIATLPQMLLLFDFFFNRKKRLVILWYTNTTWRGDVICASNTRQVLPQTPLIPRSSILCKFSEG